MNEEPKFTREQLKNAKRAHSFHVMLCSDPDCGPHIILEDVEGKPYAEMVIGRDSVPALRRWLLECL